MKVALLQLNLTVGNIRGNADKIIAAAKRAKTLGADLCVTSELALLGYPPRDLLFMAGFVKDSVVELKRIAAVLKKCPPVLVGTAMPNKSAYGKPFHNAAVLLEHGKITNQFNKTLLPTYDVFDEDRYFEPSSEGVNVFEIKGKRIAVTICEDVWNDNKSWAVRRYRVNPIRDLVARGVDCIINLSASPFVCGKQRVREKMLSAIAKKYETLVLYANQVGGNDELIFDGRSSVFGTNGKLVARGAAFEEDIVIADLDSPAGRICKDDFDEEAEAYAALVCGTRDYVKKCGFKKAILGLSGGIDSALTATIAVAALGKENVTGVLMPSPYSSEGSVKDALKLAANLGIKTITIPIEKIMRDFDEGLSNAFAGFSKNVAEENIQSRIRGNLLMALSNKYGALLLTTGNKSELAVGYCTIYGDMAGGLAVISDVPKTMVYRLADWINKKIGKPIPKSSIAKAPSAELRPNQKDQDSLPPYEVLDEILHGYIELNQSEDQIIKRGFGRNVVKKVLCLVTRAEFKRRQAAPGLKITSRAFGVGWRRPIACRLDFC